MAEFIAPQGDNLATATEYDRDAVDMAFDTLRSTLMLVYARAPLLLDNIRLRVRQLSSEWASDDIPVNKQHNAQQSATHPGSALPSTQPPGWRPAAPDPDSNNSVSIDTLAGPISSKDGSSPGTTARAGEPAHSQDANSLGTAAETSDSAEGTQMRTITPDLSCLHVWGVAVTEGVPEPSASVSSQTSTKASAIFEPQESVQDTSRRILTRISDACTAFDAAQCGTDTTGVNAGDKNGDQTAHAGGTLDEGKTGTVHEEAEGDGDQEVGRVDEEEEEDEPDGVRESDLENEDGSEEEDDGDGHTACDNGDEEDNDQEESVSEAEVELASKGYNNVQGQRKLNNRHTVSGEDTVKLTCQPPPLAGARNSNDEASDEVIEVRDNTRNSTDSAHCSDSALSAVPGRRSDRLNLADREEKCLEVHASNPAAGSGVAETMSARSPARSRRSNGLTREPLTVISTRSGRVDADNDGSTGTDDGSLSTERELNTNDGDDDNDRHVPIDSPGPGPKPSRTPRKRASATIANVFMTPTKRQKLSSDISASLTIAVVKNVPSRLMQPPKLMQLIADMLDDIHKDAALPLTCFFFSVASPFALGQLREACVSVRNSQRGGLATEETGVRQSVQALDCIDMHEHVSPILRRYHLVRLVERRDELYNGIVESVAKSWSLAPRRGLRKQTAAVEAAGTKRAAKLALERLISEAYPEHEKEMKKSTAQHEKDFKIFQNRLSNGHNWNVLKKEFGAGILALVPAGANAGFSNTDIERTKHHAFLQILSLLREQRGGMLLQMSKTVSERIYDVLLGRPGAPVFLFEGDGREVLDEAPYDSPALIGRCKLQHV